MPTAYLPGSGPRITNRMHGDLPQEWGVVPTEILQALIPLDVKTLHLPGGQQRIVNFKGMMTPEQKALVDSILAGRWFLVRNGGVLPRSRCIRCHSYDHTYLTLGCIEKPYNGLGEIVAMIQRETQRGVARVVKIVRGRRQHLDKPLMETTIDAVEIGAIEPITPQKAAELIDRINAKNYRWRGPVPDLRGVA